MIDKLPNPLILRGTDHPEPAEKAPELHREYCEKLSAAWPKRGRGVSHDAIQAAMVLILVPLFFLAGWRLFVVIVIGESVRPDLICFVYWAALGMLALAMFGVMQLIVYLANIDHRTRWNSFRKLPVLRKASIELADPENDEVPDEYLPILNVGGRKYWLLIFRNRRDGNRAPTGCLVFDDRGRIVNDESLMEKVYLMACMGTMCRHTEQKEEWNVLWDSRHAIRFRISDAANVIRRNRRLFEDLGMMESWNSILDGAETLKTAWKETLTVVDGENAFRRAAGFAFALEFFHEDAAKLRDYFLSYVRYMNAAYRNKIAALSTVCAQAGFAIQMARDCEHAQGLLAALSKLAVMAPSVVLEWIWRREFLGIADDDFRRKYREKTLWAKSRGWPVAE